jgi:hypothetical protein
MAATTSLPALLAPIPMRLPNPVSFSNLLFLIWLRYLNNCYNETFRSIRTDFCIRVCRINLQMMIFGLDGAWGWAYEFEEAGRGGGSSDD